MGGSGVLNPKNLAEIFNRQLFAAIKTQGDIHRLSLSLLFQIQRNRWKWTGKKDDFKATERKMNWLVLGGSQMNKCIYEFASQRRDEAAATFSQTFLALSYQFNNSHGPNFLFADTQFNAVLRPINKIHRSWIYFQQNTWYKGFSDTKNLKKSIAGIKMPD